MKSSKPRPTPPVLYAAICVLASCIHQQSHVALADSSADVSCWLPIARGKSPCSRECGRHSFKQTYNCKNVDKISALESDADACNRAMGYSAINPAPDTVVCRQTSSEGGAQNQELWRTCRRECGKAGCEAGAALGISWPNTSFGEVATVPCPLSTGQGTPVGTVTAAMPVTASRLCTGDPYNTSQAQWQEADFSNCSKAVPQQMDKGNSSNNTGGNLTNTNQSLFVSLQLQQLRDDASSDLAQSTQNIANRLRSIAPLSSTFTSQHVALVVDIVEFLANATDTATVPNEVVNTTLLTISDLLDAPLDALLDSQQRHRSSTRLLEAVDKLSRATLLLLYPRAESEFVASNIVVSLKCLDPQSFGTHSKFGMYDSSHRYGDGVGDVAVHLPSNFPVSDKQSAVHHSCEHQMFQLVKFQNSKLFQDGDNATQKLPVEQSVVSVSVGAASVDNLLDSVQLRFRIQADRTNESSYTHYYCAYWNLDSNGGLGGWATDGIVDMDTDIPNTHVCSTSHLTHFAILADIRSRESSPPAPMSLSFLSIVGCCLSIIGVVATFFTLMLPAFRKQLQAKIIASLCVAILGFLTFFLISVYGAVKGNACIVIGTFLHYFFLTALLWMLMEGVHLSALVINVFSSTSISVNKRLAIMSMVAWGVPLAIAAITAAVSSSSYGTGDICYVHGDANLVSVVVPLVLILLANWVIFFIAVYRIVSHRRRMRKAAVDDECHSKLQDCVRDLKSAFALFILLGLTWTMALFVVDTDSLALKFIFVILNSSQGFAIFLVHVLLREKARGEWKRVLGLGTAGSSTPQTISTSASWRNSGGWRRLSTLRRQFSARSSGSFSPAQRRKAPATASSQAQSSSCQFSDVVAASSMKQEAMSQQPSQLSTVPLDDLSINGNYDRMDSIDGQRKHRSQISIGVESLPPSYTETDV